MENEILTFLKDFSDQNFTNESKLIREKILISACLLGENCKYNGKNNANPKITDALQKLSNECEFIAVCPEILGGLSTPREPAEIKSSRVITISGHDVSANFYLGAQKCVQIAEQNECKLAILKERSPSCSSTQIYSGEFNGKLVAGLGVSAQALLEAGVMVCTEGALVENFNTDGNLLSLKNLAKSGKNETR